MAESWRCPYCNVLSIPKSRSSDENERLSADSVVGNLTTTLSADYPPKRTLDLRIAASLTQCQNPDCMKYELTVRFGTRGRPHGYDVIDDELGVWRLVPASAARVLPDYIPQVIREDYEEACAILPASPKAAATLARRALQGMIRDFWRVTAGTLYNEIEQLKGQVQQEDWEAIDATRKVGNIGAHMQEDINVIVEVDEGEAAKLIGLIEILVDDWYIHRHERQEHLASVVEIAEDKAEERAEQTAAAQAEPAEPPEA